MLLELQLLEISNLHKLNNGLYGTEFIEVRDQIKNFIIEFVKVNLC